MQLNTYFKNPLQLFGWTFFALFLLYLLIEGSGYAAKPTVQTKDQHISQSLDKAQKLFQQRQEHFAKLSHNMSGQLQERIERKFSPSSIYRYLQENPLFWGITLYKNGEPYLWEGFAHEIPEGETLPVPDSSYTDIRKDNNVVYWLNHTGFTVSDSTGISEYHLFTTNRIEQSNTLPIGIGTEYHFTDNQRDSDTFSYPVSYSFFNPLPETNEGYRVLRTAFGDSTGVVYASTDSYRKALSNWEESIQFWRVLFILLCILTIGTLSFRWFDRMNVHTGLFSQLLLVFLGWIIFHFIFFPGQWLQFIIDLPGNSEMQQTYPLLTNYSLDSIFIALIAWTHYRKILKPSFQLKFEEMPALLAAGGLAGVGSAAAILAVTSKSYFLITRLNVPLFELHLIPQPGTIILLLAFGLMIFSLYAVLNVINWFLFQSTKIHFKAAVAILSLGFLLGLVLSQLFLPESIRLNWATILSVFIFATALGISLMYVLYPHVKEIMSPLKITVLASLLIALSGTPIIYNAYLAKQDSILKEKAREFNKTDDPYARSLTEQILRSLGEEYRNITVADLTQRVPFIQSSFTKTVEQSIAMSQRNYSIDLQLIRPTGKLVASYSTELNSPDWIEIYDLPYLAAVFEQQRITRSTNRPVVQLPQLKNQERYKTFYRGWIALFGEQTETPIGWILCSVYQERPNYNKPIRAVMASLTSEDWRDTFQISEYLDGKLIRNVQQGVTGYFPTYHLLLSQEKNALKNNSELFYTYNSENDIYRHYLWNYSPEKVIRASTLYPDLKTILFEFFKFSFLLLSAGFILLVAYKSFHFRQFKILGKISRFQHRILDSFLIATILFLGILVFASQFVIRHQNQGIVRQELVDKLESLGTSVEKNRKFQQSLGNGVSFSLDSLASPLNADASFYSGLRVDETTTPQIYRQHLLQETLPYTVYEELYQDQKSTALRQVNLASQTLLVGYRTIFSPEGEPVAALSIPTFYHSPKYNQQLLETTSYLIVLYLFVFGIFMGGTVIIARQLTHPLESIQKGLNKISEGNLDTTIPVTGNDEIGQLASAYNEMVSRLKELRKELAIAEREAAWKEMAQQVAHEIKNPLTPMKLSVQHLRRQITSGVDDPVRLKKQIEKITQNLVDQIQLLNTIASDFSKFSKPIDEEFSEISVNELIESVFDLYQHDSGISLCMELTDKQPVTLGARDEIKRAVINLVKNAFEASGDGGTIYLRTYLKESSVFIEVEDHGEGINEEDKSKIFVPNFSTKSSGTGLGLAISKKIIEAHHGSITFASIEDKGTTFIIKLPLNEHAG